MVFGLCRGEGIRVTAPGVILWKFRAMTSRGMAGGQMKETVSRQSS